MRSISSRVKKIEEAIAARRGRCIAVITLRHGATEEEEHKAKETYLEENGLKSGDVDIWIISHLFYEPAPMTKVSAKKEEEQAPQTVDQEIDGILSDLMQKHGMNLEEIADVLKEPSEPVREIPPAVPPVVPPSRQDTLTVEPIRFDDLIISKRRRPGR